MLRKQKRKKNTISILAVKSIMLCASLSAAGPGRLVKVKGETSVLEPKLRPQSNLFTFTEFEGLKKEEWKGVCMCKLD